MTQLSETTIAALPSFKPVPAAGQYVFTNSPGAVASSTPGINAVRLTPWLIERPMPFDRLGAEVVIAGEAGSKFRIMLYGDTGNCAPGPLIVDAGQIAGDSATVQELSVSLALTPGLYWIGGAVQAVTTTQPTMRTISGFLPPVLLRQGISLPAAGATVVGASFTAAGAAPATAPTSGGSNQGVRMFARIA